MMVCSGRFLISTIIRSRYALSFLILIGVALIGDGLEMHIPKGYIYFAKAFTQAVEMVNMRIRGRQGVPVHLHSQYVEEEEAPDKKREEKGSK
jgi:predicted tellurium resistance membrane protein TerC